MSRNSSPVNLKTMPLNPFFDPKVILELIKRFFSDTIKTVLLIAIVALGFIFYLLNKSQEERNTSCEERNIKCETKNYIQDVKIDILTSKISQRDSILNRVMGRLEAIEELKKTNNQ